MELTRLNFMIVHVICYLRKPYLCIVKVKVPQSPIAILVVGLEADCIFDAADDRRSPFLSFCCIVNIKYSNTNSEVFLYGHESFQN